MIGPLGFLSWRHSFRYWGIAIVLIAIGTGYFLSAPWAAIRYPGGVYFFSLPLIVLATAMEWASPLNAQRLTNVLAILAWLLLLRPLLLNRRPNAGALLFGSLFFFHKDVVYYFSTAYLEPWGVMVGALTVEYLFLSERDFKPWVPCLLVGAGAAFKENVILMLPFVWLAAYGRPVSRGR